MANKQPVYGRVNIKYTCTCNKEFVFQAVISVFIQATLNYFDYAQ